MREAGAAEQTGEAVCARAERRSVLRQELGAALDDRRRLAERLHDGPHQLLLSAGMRLAMLRDDAPPEQRAQLGEIARQITAARDELRRLSTELSVSVGGGVQADALREFLDRNARSAGWTATFVDHGLGELTDRVYLTIARSIGVRLAAMRDDADVRHVRVEVGEVRGEAVVDIESEPAAGDRARLDAALGSIRDRVALVGGSAELTEDGGRPARVRIRIPTGAQPSPAGSNGSSSTNTEPTGSPAR